MLESERLLVCAALLLLLAAPARAAEAGGQAVRLWPEMAPGERGPVEAEKVEGERVTYVGEPALVVFPAPKEKATGVGLIIAPGGAYSFLSWALEGTEIAHWFNNAGVTAFVLKYRVPRRSFDPGSRLPLMDAQRAVSLVRRRAKEWDLDPGKMGFRGFPAGGPLGATLENNAARRAYEPVDEADKTSCRPDFTVLIYPGGMIDPKNPGQLA